MEKIFFEITKNNKTETESLWANKLEGNEYKIMNVPFYAKGINLNDIIKIKKEKEGLIFDTVFKYSGHSTYRFFIINKNYTNSEFNIYWEPLERIGCSYEKATKFLFAVDVPPSTNIILAYSLLQKGENANFWEFEEGDCQHKIN